MDGAPSFQQPEPYRLGHSVPFVDFQRREDAQAAALEVMSGWMYMLSGSGTLTIQETFRCSVDLRRQARQASRCHLSVISPCPWKRHVALVALTYLDPDANQHVCDTFLTWCDKNVITSVHVTAAAAHTVTAATWMNATQVLIGTMDGRVHVLTLRSASKPNSNLKLHPVLDLRSHRGRVCAIHTLGELAHVEEGSSTQEGPCQCVLVATARELFAFVAPGSALDVLKHVEAGRDAAISRAHVCGTATEVTDEPYESRLSVSPERPNSDYQKALWQCGDVLTVMDVNIRAATVAAGWSAMCPPDQQGVIQLPDLLPPGYVCSSAVADHWFLLLFAHPLTGATSVNACVFIASQITHTVAQVLSWPASSGMPVGLAVDGLPAADDAAPGTCAVFCVGKQGVAPLLATPAASEVWHSFAAAGRYEDALAHIEDLELERLDLQAAGQEAASRPEGASTPLTVAKAKVLYAAGRALVAQQDFVAAANKFGKITAAMGQAAGLPDFRRLCLAFQGDADSESAQVVAAKEDGLVVFLHNKLRFYRNKPPDAAATCLALWLLELLLKRSSSALPAAPAGTASASAAASVAGDGPPASSAAAADEEDDGGASGAAAAAGAGAPRPSAAGSGGSGLAALSVQALIADYQAHLPLVAVQEVLREGGRRRDLIFAARLYGDWLALFTQLLPSDLPRALRLLPKLPVDQLVANLNAALHQDPVATFAALTTDAALARLNPLHVVGALTSFAHPGVAAAKRAAAVGYLHDLIFEQRCTEPCIHDLYVVLLILGGDAAGVQRYIHSPVSRSDRGPRLVMATGTVATVGAFTFNARRAAMLAKQHGQTEIAQRVMVELGNAADALRLEQSYEERLAIIEEVPDADVRKNLWLAAMQLELDKVGGDKVDTAARLLALDRAIGDSVQKGTSALEDALSLLPPQRTLRACKQVLVKHMEATSLQVQQTLARTEAAVLMNNALDFKVKAYQHRKGALSWEATCAACGSQLNARPGWQVPYGGAIPPVQAYASGAVLHTSCAAELLARFSPDKAYSDALRRCLAQLAGMKKSVTDVPGNQKIHALQYELFKLLKGDPLNSDSAVNTVSAPFGESAFVASWEVPDGADDSMYSLYASA